jgi:ketosteroid isomerase-like protein
MTIPELLDAWAGAEVAGDRTHLAPLLDDDFTAIGPLGFTLSRDDFLGRHGSGLEYAAFAVDEREVRQDGETALVTARLNATGSYRGAPVPEAVRATIALTGSGGRWRMVRVHMSFIAGTVGAPPVPAHATNTGITR